MTGAMGGTKPATSSGQVARRGPDTENRLCIVNRLRIRGVPPPNWWRPAQSRRTHLRLPNVRQSRSRRPRCRAARLPWPFVGRQRLRRFVSAVPEAKSAFAIGRTEGSLVVICAEPAGQYEYLGVRLSDAAVLRTDAETNSAREFLAQKSGVVYAVSPTELKVSPRATPSKNRTDARVPRSTSIRVS